MGRLSSRHAREFAAVKDLCTSDADSATLRERLGERLSRHLGASSYCFGATDPSTALPVHSISVGLEPAAMQAFFRLVLATPTLDFGAWVVNGRRVATIEQLVDDTERDPYVTEILRPAQLRYDVQASFASAGRSWGHLCLRRRSADNPYEAHELRFLEAISPHVTSALRSSAARAMARANAATSTGVVVVGPDGRVEMVNEVAEQLIRLPVSGTRHSLLTGVHIVLAKLERLLADEIDDVPEIVLQDEVSNRRYRLRAERTVGADGRPRGLVLITPSGLRLADRLNALVQCGLSPREGEVALAVVRGESVKSTATALHVSVHTVNDHLRTAYQKLGVANRQQLAVRILSL